MKTTKPLKVKKPKSTNTTKNYLSNKDILKQLVISFENDQPTDEFMKMMILLVDRYATKGNYAKYSYLDEMKASAILSIVRGWRQFDISRDNANPFAYFTQAAYHAFAQYLKYEKNQQRIRDSLIIAHGGNASFGFSESGDDDDYSSHNSLVNTECFDDANISEFEPKVDLVPDEE